MQALPLAPPSGIPVNSRYLPVGVSSVISDATALPVHKGTGYGFIFERIGAGPHPPVIIVEVGGFGRVSSRTLFVTPDKWYDVPFSYLNVIIGQAVSTYSEFTGALGLNIAELPYAFVRPASRSALTDFPALSGGNPPGYNLRNTVGAVPTLVTEGVALVNQSVFAVYVACDENETITGGAVDIYRWISQISFWAKSHSAVPVPVDHRHVQVIFDGSMLAPIGFREPGDRLAVVNNGITVSGGSAPTLYLGIQ